MKFIGINGSPRKSWNTHTLVEEALKGAANRGAETELIHLYDLRFRGCISCFECKRTGGPSVGRCAAKDDLKPVLEKIEAADGLVIGSPIYIGEVSASTRALIERLTFQYISYNKERKPLLNKKISTGLIFTMNAGESHLEQIGYRGKFDGYVGLFNMLIGPAKYLISTETLQTEDYGKYEMSAFDVDARKKRREQTFPLDCNRAFKMGTELADAAAGA